MDRKERMSRENARDYFKFIANLGMTKHYGSMAATRELVEMCHIDSGATVLDVGCGVGATPSYLAEAVGCRVVGIDLIRRMVEQSRTRAKAREVESDTAFAVGDARRLPFADEMFDAVITESVNVFFADKALPMREYVRVTKPGGYVGMTEMTWLKPPSPELEKTFRSLVHARASDREGWRELMSEASLREVVASAHRIDFSGESRGRLERYGPWTLVKTVLRTVGLVLSDRQSRRFLGGGVGALSKDLLDVVGYGVYAGRKERDSSHG